MKSIDVETILKFQNPSHRDCLEACIQCFLACDMCSDACLEEDDIEKMVPCIRLDRECAESCLAAIRAITRGSDQVESICRLTAELCDKCADECAQHEAEHCQVCAEACRRCAEECRKMAA